MKFSVTECSAVPPLYVLRSVDALRSRCRFSRISQRVPIRNETLVCGSFSERVLCDAEALREGCNRLFSRR